MWCIAYIEVCVVVFYEDKGEAIYTLFKVNGKKVAYQYRMSLAECRSYLTIEHRDRRADSRNFDKASMLAK